MFSALDKLVTGHPPRRDSAVQLSRTTETDPHPS